MTRGSVSLVIQPFFVDYTPSLTVGLPPGLYGRRTGGVPCLDARNVVRFGLTGDGRLLDNLGTSTGARKVELFNGRALISAELKGPAIISVSSEGLPTTFLKAEARP